MSSFSNVSESSKTYTVPSIQNCGKNTNTTDIGSIINLDTNFSSFLNDPHKQYQLHLTMIDGATSRNIDGMKHRVACFWCRHRFDSAPIGCPLRYVPNQVEKTLHTRANETYTINENIASSEIVSDQKQTRENYYETDGVFCSFNCCSAFIDDNYTDSRYKFSRSLMMGMFCAVNDIDPRDVPERIRPAPSWRLLTEYGGHLSIEEFRASFDSVAFTETHRLNNVPVSRPIAVMYEEKRFM